MKKFLVLLLLTSSNLWSDFDDICLIPNLDLLTVKKELKEKDCEKNDILYVMTKKQNDLQFMLSNYCMYRNHEIKKNVTQEIGTVYHLICVYRGEGRTCRD